MKYKMVVDFCRYFDRGEIMSLKLNISMYISLNNATIFDDLRREDLRRLQETDVKRRKHHEEAVSRSLETD